MAWPPPSPHVFVLEGGANVVLFLNGEAWDIWYVGDKITKGKLDDWTTRNIADGTKVLQLFFEGTQWAEIPILTHIKKG